MDVHEVRIDLLMSIVLFGQLLKTVGHSPVIEVDHLEFISQLWR